MKVRSAWGILSPKLSPISHPASVARGLTVVVVTGMAFAMGLLGCRGGDDQTPALVDRLWVTDLPTSPREQFRGFAVAELKGRRAGALYTGSMFDGRQQAFKLAIQGDKVTFTFLQDDTKVMARVRSCRPTTGFHVCVEVVGDELVAGRYQSRKRWTLRRSRDAHSDPSVSVPALLRSIEDSNVTQHVEP